MPDATDFSRRYGTAVASFGSAGTLSSTVNLGGAEIVGLINLGTWTPAHLGFEHQVSSIWTNVIDSAGNPSTVPSSALITGGGSVTVMLGVPTVLRGLDTVRLRAGAVGGTAQTAARAIILLVKP